MKLTIKITVIAGLMLQAMFTNAQNSDKVWSVGLFAGKNEYNGDLGNAMFKFNKASYNFGALSLNRYLCKSFDLGLQVSYGQYGYWKDPHIDDYSNFKYNKTQGGLLLKYKLANGYILKEEAKLAPYVAIGAAVAGYDNSDGLDAIMPIGAGVKYNINETFAVQYQALYNFTNSELRDYQAPEKRKDHFLEHTIGLVISFGNPKDSDGDGIFDKLDKCPKVAGILENKGCPDLNDDVKNVFAKALTGIQFESGKDVIMDSSFPILDNVVRIMQQNPSFVIEINGHTDSQGDAAANMTLSENRAAAVKKYIADKGVDPSRMTAAGFGATMPIADNSTPEGRTKNRRVEFKVVY